jgi:hypothetical protein
MSRTKYDMRNFIDLLNEMVEPDLTEDMKLKMLPDQIRNARGSYGAFVISMHPDDFLELTTSDENEKKSIYAKQFPIPKDEYADRMAGLSIADKEGQYQMPYLNVEFPSGKVVGHEGRHRAAMILKNGGTSIPVTIYPREDTIWRTTIEFENEDWEVVDSISQDFRNHSDANHFALDYMLGKRLPPEGLRFGKDKIECLRGNALRGAPARSEGPWKNAKWQASDFPDKLICQYHDWLSVPKSRFKIGLVKGYRHHFDR